jgi:hypothetical protein
VRDLAALEPVRVPWVEIMKAHDAAALEIDAPFASTQRRLTISASSAGRVMRVGRFSATS